MSEYSEAVVTDLEAMVRNGLTRWDMSPDASVRLLNLSENATWRVDDGDRCLILRLHRLGYRTVPEIESELRWIQALRADGVVETPAPVAARDGSLVQSLLSPGGLPSRFAVSFELAPGAEPAQGADLVDWFRLLGTLTAAMHEHTRVWAPPAGFTRKAWDFDAIFGPEPIWGDWRLGLGMDDAGRALAARAVDVIERRLLAFGKGRERFGLIHADLRLANLLVDGPHLRVIDFDDCGLGWYAHDFATAVSFFEHEPIVPALMDAWVAGYRARAPFSVEDEAELPMFVMLRRLMLIAWVASHAETPTAQALGTAYTDGGLAMAESFLTRFA